LEEKLLSSKTELRRLVEAHAVTNFETKTVLSIEETKQLAVPGVYKIGKSRIIRLV
jgi:hypothetical protein